MGKKTAPIVVQALPKIKVHIRSGSVIDAWHVVDSFRIIPADNGSKQSSGIHMCMRDKRSISFPCIIRKARIG
jgi:hypothetical protein